MRKSQNIRESNEWLMNECEHNSEPVKTWKPWISVKMKDDGEDRSKKKKNK